MAAALRVGRTLLREAIRRLISESRWSSRPPAVVDGAVISEVYAVRAAMDSLMARNACLKATAANIEALHRNLARNAALVEFAGDAMQQGMARPAKIAEIAGNSWAGRFHDQISGQMDRYQHFTDSTQERRDQALTHHRTLVDAVAGGGPGKAAKIVFDHVTAARDAALRVISGIGRNIA